MRKIERFIIAVPICFTLLVGWFSWSAFQAAPEVAEENLRGAGLSIAAAIEQLAAVDSALQSLGRYHSADIAYFSLIDQQKIVRFHTNFALVGTVSAEVIPILDSKSGIYEGRKKLGTGEEIYLLQTTIHGAGDYLLTLGLHTFRADRVIRRTQTGVTVVSSLTISLWLVTLGVMFLLRRDEQHQHRLARQEELARLGELGAVMAHEIRNPLAGIKGFAQLVETAETVDQARHYADRIVAQSLRMELLVNDLLSFAREDREDRQSVDLEALVSDSVTMTRAEADSAGILVTYTPLHTALKVMVVSDRIVQLLLNLLKNGLQAMPDGGELRVELGKIQSRAVIRVQDSGIGIPKGDLPHIFKPFWTSKARGTGLGLALCHKIAMEHGGSLTVESIVGTGTTFTLHLPLEI